MSYKFCANANPFYFKKHVAVFFIDQDVKTYESQISSTCQMLALCSQAHKTERREGKTIHAEPKNKIHSEQQPDPVLVAVMEAPKDADLDNDAVELQECDAVDVVDNVRMRSAEAVAVRVATAVHEALEEAEAVSVACRLEVAVEDMGAAWTGRQHTFCVLCLGNQVSFLAFLGMVLPL